MSEMTFNLTRKLGCIFSQIDVYMKINISFDSAAGHLSIRFQCVAWIGAGKDIENKRTDAKQI